MNSYYIFYVYTHCELGISGKQIFDVLPGRQDPCPIITTDHLSVDFRDTDMYYSV